MSESSSDTVSAKGFPKLLLAMAIAAASSLGTLLVEKLSHHGSVLVSVICAALWIAALSYLKRIIFLKWAPNPTFPNKTEHVSGTGARVFAAIIGVVLIIVAFGSLYWFRHDIAIYRTTWFEEHRFWPLEFRAEADPPVIFLGQTCKIRLFVNGQVATNQIALEGQIGSVPFSEVGGSINYTAPINLISPPAISTNIPVTIRILNASEHELGSAKAVIHARYSPQFALQIEGRSDLFEGETTMIRVRANIAGPFSGPDLPPPQYSFNWRCDNGIFTSSPDDRSTNVYKAAFSLEQGENERPIKITATPYLEQNIRAGADFSTTINVHRPNNRYTVFVLDATARMIRTNGPDLFAYANQQIVKKLVDAPSYVGIEIFGGSPANSANDCENLRELAPLKPRDPDSAITKLRSIKAHGYRAPLIKATAAAIHQLAPYARDQKVTLYLTITTGGGDTCQLEQVDLLHSFAEIQDLVDRSELEGLVREDRILTLGLIVERVQADHYKRWTQVPGHIPIIVAEDERRFQRVLSALQSLDATNRGRREEATETIARMLDEQGDQEGAKKVRRIANRGP